MTRWTSPDERTKPTIAPWGHCVIGTNQVNLCVREDDLTVNMYGSTTQTYDLLVEIVPDSPEGYGQTLSLPGKVQSSFVLRRNAELFCIFELLKREYVLFDSNATHDIQRDFIVAIPSGFCWVSENHEWKPWNSETPAQCPDEVRAYISVRRLFGPLASAPSPPAKRKPRLFPSVSSLRKAGNVWGAIILVFSLLALPVRLALYPGGWFCARKDYREAVARHSARQSEWNDMAARFAEIPLTRETTECFTVK